MELIIIVVAFMSYVIGKRIGYDAGYDTAEREFWTEQLKIAEQQGKELNQMVKS